MKSLREIIDDYRSRGAYTKPYPLSQIARRFGITRQQLHNIMSGRSTPHEWTVNRIARALGIGPDEVRQALKQKEK